MVTTLCAQSQSAATFTASIKRNDSVNANSSTSFLPGGRFSSRFNPLSRLIITAYRIKDYQLSGGPGWVYAERYDIDAKAEDNPSRDQMRMMIQSLLKERFKLNLRRENKELSVYVLALGKGGIKFGKAADRPSSGFEVDPGRIAGYGVTMAELADQLSRMMDRPVVDNTGVEGRFDLVLRYRSVDTTGNGPSPDSSAPDVLTAIGEQLGLRLEAAKAPVEVLVIDHAEKPDAN
jgi:uncharacterized protein (TIGR03435 family)